MEYSSKAAYLKGLVEGMNLDSSKEETKIFNVIVDLLQDLSKELKNLKCDCAENKELIYELDEDLGEVERVVFECEHSSDCKEKGGSCNCKAGRDDLSNGDYDEHDEYVKKDDEYDEDEDDDDDDVEEEKYEVLCPHCSQVINLEDADLKGNEIVCPKCGKELELDFDDGGSGEKTIEY